MPQVTIFRWRSGLGWLVLSGGGRLDSDDNVTIEAAMLGHTVSQGPLAYIWAASDLESADRHMDLLSDLGARTGYLVDVLTEDDTTLFHQLSEAGVIILGDGPRQETLRDALAGSALRGIEEAFRQGATIYAVGASASLVGEFIIEDGEIKPGYRWLERATVLPGYTSEQAAHLHGVVQQVPDGFGLGVAHGAALAFGPLGEVEVWGNQAITVTLGKNYV